MTGSQVTFFDYDPRSRGRAFGGNHPGNYRDGGSSKYQHFTLASARDDTRDAGHLGSLGRGLDSHLEANGLLSRRARRQADVLECPDPDRVRLAGVVVSDAPAKDM